MTRPDNSSADAGHDRADASVSAHARCRDRRVMELRAKKTIRIPAAAGRGRRDLAHGGRSRPSGSRNSASASSVSCVRTCATCCATITVRAIVGPATWLRRGARDAPAGHGPTGARSEGGSSASASAISRSAARRCARRVLPLPTTPSFRSRSASSTDSTTRSKRYFGAAGRSSMFDLKTLSPKAVPERSRRRSGTGFSTSRARPKASASTCSRPTPTTRKRS